MAISAGVEFGQEATTWRGTCEIEHIATGGNISIGIRAGMHRKNAPAELWLAGFPNAFPMGTVCTRGWCIPIIG